MVEHLRSLLVAALAAEIRANNPHGSHNPPPALDEGPAGL